MAEDFETLAATAAAALDTHHQWVNEPIQQMVLLHLQSLQEIKELEARLDASFAREEAQKSAHALTGADRDWHKEQREQLALSHANEYVMRQILEKDRESRIADQANADTKIGRLEDELTTKTTLLNQCENENLVFLRDLEQLQQKYDALVREYLRLPRKYGHNSQCNCFRCIYVKEKAVG